MRWALALACLASGCDRGCAREPPPRTVDARVAVDVTPNVTHGLSARCVREITHAAIGHPSGTGGIDTLSVACDHGVLAVWALRGHVLSRIERNLSPGQHFSAPTVIAQGADRLGPVAERAVRGPVAWRSPTSDLTEELERDTVWAGLLRDGDGGAQTLRADLTMPAGVAGVGLVLALSAAGERVSVLASHGSADSPPGVFRHELALEPRAPAVLEAMPAPVWEGELDGYEFSRATALLREHVNDGASFVATRAGVSQRVATRGPLTMVAPRGVRVGDASAFLQADFALGGDGGRCLRLSDSVCVSPRALSLLVVRDEGVRRIEVAAQGIPDALAADARGVVAMFVSVDAEQRPVQRAVRIDVNTGSVNELEITPPEAMPAIDRPALVTCEGEVWLAAEVAAPESSVTALPLECVLAE